MFVSVVPYKAHWVFSGLPNWEAMLTHTWVVPDSLWDRSATRKKTQSESGILTITQSFLADQMNPKDFRRTSESITDQGEWALVLRVHFTISDEQMFTKWFIICKCLQWGHASLQDFMFVQEKTAYKKLNKIPRTQGGSVWLEGIKGSITLLQRHLNCDSRENSGLARSSHFWC